MSEQEKRNPGELIKFGALWTGKGKSLFTGSVNNDIRIVVLENQRKEKDNQPDAFIFLAKKEWEAEKGGSTSTSTTKEKDDLPF
jgi:hypothetical protein